MEDVKSRIGQFFFFMGVILVIIFIAAWMAHSANYTYLLGGIVFIALGGYLIWQDYKAPQPSGRFGMFNKIKEKRKKE